MRDTVDAQKCVASEDGIFERNFDLDGTPFRRAAVILAGGEGPFPLSVTGSVSPHPTRGRKEVAVVPWLRLALARRRLVQASR